MISDHVFSELHKHRLSSQNWKISKDLKSILDIITYFIIYSFLLIYNVILL